MNTLRPEVIGELLLPFVDHPNTLLLERLAVYLQLLIRWNVRTNLTAVRDPAEIVLRHFGESLFAARHLGKVGSLLDYGSGAGFPGLPIALARPDMSITVAESQHKKAAFLREVVRTLELPVEVWGARVEEMPADRAFECVTLRAVDRMDSAVATAAPRALTSLVLLTTTGSLRSLLPIRNFSHLGSSALPGSVDRVVATFLRD